MMDHNGERFMNDSLGTVGSAQRRELERLNRNVSWAEMDAEQRRTVHAAAWSEVRIKHWHTCWRCWHSFVHMARIASRVMLKEQLALRSCIMLCTMLT